MHPFKRMAINRNVTIFTNSTRLGTFSTTIFHSSHDTPKHHTENGNRFSLVPIGRALRRFYFSSPRAYHTHTHARLCLCVCVLAAFSAVGGVSRVSVAPSSSSVFTSQQPAAAACPSSSLCSVVRFTRNQHGPHGWFVCVCVCVICFIPHTRFDPFHRPYRCTAGGQRVGGRKPRDIFPGKTD